MGTCLVYSRNSKEAFVTGGSGVKEGVVGDTVKEVTNVLQVPDYGYSGHCKDFDFYSDSESPWPF